MSSCAARLGGRRSAAAVAVRRWLPAATVLSLLAWGAAPSVASGSGERADEYEVKAALLYNFAKFVVWPEEAERDRGTMALCVVGSDPFGSALERVLEGKSVRGRELEIHRYLSVDAIRDCDLVFVGRSLARDPGDVLEAIRGQGVLIVADSGDFARRGGAINLVERGNRIGFEINPSAVRREGLVVSSKLLRLAQVVEE